MMLAEWLPEKWKQAIRRRAGAVLMEDRLRNLRKAGFSPKRIIDAGAHQGDWTRVVKDVFPEAAVLMIEPMPECREELGKITARWKDVRHRAALLGAEPGQACFRIEGTNSRMVASGEKVPEGVQVLELPVETLAEVARQEGFGECDFLKMDLQGYELAVLAGAGPIFGACEVIFLEVSWIRIGEVPLVSEVIRKMEEKKYVPYDVMNLNYRPLDRALWQGDFVFVRQDSPIRACNSWA